MFYLKYIFLYVLPLFSLNIPNGVIGNFAHNQAKKYDRIGNLGNGNPKHIRDDKNYGNILVSGELYADIPDKKFEMIVYNTSELLKSPPSNLDDLLVKSHNKLISFGMLVLDPPNIEVESLAYNYILQNPQELWNYNLVNIEIHGNKISARKGNLDLFKNRRLLEIDPTIGTFKPILTLNDTSIQLPFININKITGMSGVDYFLNMIGFLIQYMFIFNFFSFGLMLVIKTIRP